MIIVYSNFIVSCLVTFKYSPLIHISSYIHFCSKSSIMDSEVTITQSAFHFAHSGKAGTTSKWLRLSLIPGDDIEVIFSSTNFHLPQDENAPVISECLVLFLCHTYTSSHCILTSYTMLSHLKLNDSDCCRVGDCPFPFFLDSQKT